MEQSSTLDDITVDLEDKVDMLGHTQLDRINEELIREALKMMKPNKKDAVFDAMSDFYIHGPPELVSHLTVMLKMFLSHGTLPFLLLVCTLLPLVKDNMADSTSSDNYRAIAGGCLLLKLIDVVILLLEGDKLGCDSL